MSDITTRLRDFADLIEKAGNIPAAHIMREAAGVIERSEAENRKLRAEVSRSSYHCD